MYVMYSKAPECYVGNLLTPSSLCSVAVVGRAPPRRVGTRDHNCHFGTAFDNVIDGNADVSNCHFGAASDDAIA